jgi:hypothetical protein
MKKCIRQALSSVPALLLVVMCGGVSRGQSTSSPILPTVTNLFEIARSDTDLVIRIKAVDVLGQVAANNASDKDVSALLLSGLKDLLLNYPKSTDKIEPDKHYFRAHVVQALGNLKSAAIDVLPDLVKAKGQTAHLDRELDAAIDSIVSSVTPTQQTVDPKQTTAVFDQKSIASGSSSTLTIAVVDTGTPAKPIAGLKNNAFMFKLNDGKSDGKFDAVQETSTKGTYNVKFTGTTADPSAGNWTVTVSGVPLASKPAMIVTPGPVSGTTSTAKFDKLNIPAASNPPVTATLTIVVKDAAGNAITGLDASKFDASLKPDKMASTGAFDKVAESKTPGTYTTTFTPTAAGLPTDCIVKVNNVALDIAPKITVTPGANVGADSPAKFDKDTIKSGSTTLLEITVKDAKGNLVTGLGKSDFKLDLAGPSTGIFGDVTEPIAESGSYTATFTGKTAGAASTLTITVNGTALTAKPIITVKAGPVSASKSTAKFDMDAIKKEATATLTIAVQDAAKNPISGLKAKDFEMELSGKSGGKFAPVAESATTKGTYTATLTGTTAGTPSTLRLKISGVQVNTNAKIQVK